MSELEQMMKGMTAAFNPAAAHGVEAVIQLNATGDGGGDYIITVKDGKADLKEGVLENPSVTISVAAQDWVGIMKGEVDPVKAFMTGKLKVNGDIGVMMKFQKMFGRG
jgi:putative sterol carrier protein